MWHFLFIDFHASVYTGDLKPRKKRNPIHTTITASNKTNVENVVKPSVRINMPSKPIKIEL